MSGNVASFKRLIAITGGNLRHNHVYLSGHFDFFPAESFGQPSKKEGLGKLLTLLPEGLNCEIQTDIATQKGNGKPRCFFRNRSWVRKFFEKNGICEGDIVAIEKVDALKYKVYPFETKHIRDGTAIPDHWPEILKDKPTVIDLFAGCGGLAYGFKLAGFGTLLAVEWDKSACDTFKRNVSPRILQCAIQEFERFPECMVLIGGPPCQGFSNLGEKMPNDPRRQLWRHYLRALKDAKPLVFVLENVPPILASEEYVYIKAEAEKLGYTIDGRILNAADFGAPQQRKRAFIVGSRIGKPPFPKQTHRNPNRPSVFETANLPIWLDVRSAIQDLPPKPDGVNWHIGRNPTATSLKRYACIPPGGNRWDLPKSLTPECWKRKTQGGTDLFGRLWWNRPSVTIRTEFYKPEKGRYLHPSENRPITHREAARLQGFPDDFIFEGSRISVGIQIGNAVPPPLAFQVAKAVKKHLKDYLK